VPAKPGLLDDVLGIGEAAEHAIGHPEQHRPVLLEHRAITSISLILVDRHSRSVGSGPVGGRH